MLYDAWLNAISSVTVLDCKKDNVLYIDYGRKDGCGWAERHTVGNETLNRIKALIYENAELFFIEKAFIEHEHIVLDGVVSKFIYCLESESKSLHILNAWVLNGNESKEIKMILDLHHSIEKMLAPSQKCRECFSLT